MKASGSGLARIFELDPSAYPKVGTHPYYRPLPLENGELILTFDDGPTHPCTGSILEALAHEDIRATFFCVGYHARNVPDLIKRIHDEGHTIGTHTEMHQCIPTLPTGEREKAIDEGIASTTFALQGKAPAPFFRFPFLERDGQIEARLAARRISIWGTDVFSDDWDGVSVEQLVSRTVRLLEQTTSGIIILHDIQPVTAVALPTLLRELRNRNYRFVHVVPAGERVGS